jgi:hypothetical protein
MTGAYIMERGDDGFVYGRHVEANEEGNFIDCGLEYCSDGTVRVNNPVLVVYGDTHGVQRDEDVIDDIRNYTKSLGVKTAVFHDIFDSMTVNPHNVGKPITQSRVMERCPSISDEFYDLAEFLVESSGIYDNILIVASNHDDFVRRWADSETDDRSPNYRLSLRIREWVYDKLNPVEMAVTAFMPKVKGYVEGVEKNIRWLEAGKEKLVNGVNLGIHGDVGDNGMKTTPMKLSNSFYAKNSVCGHTHQPTVIGRYANPGCTCLLEQEYTSRNTASSWAHGMALLHQDGSKQVVPRFNGRLRPEWAVAYEARKRLEIQGKVPRRGRPVMKKSKKKK